MTCRTPLSEYLAEARRWRWGTRMRYVLTATLLAATVWFAWSGLAALTWAGFFVTIGSVGFIESERLR